MSTTKQLEKCSSKIADTIVELVNTTDGPVTLLQVEREIPGFKSDEQPAWYFAFHGNGDGFVWGGMTEAGETALRKIIYDKKVAVQFVTPQPYLIEGGMNYVHRSDWLPIMLLPARAANISTNLLARLSQRSLEDTVSSTPLDKRVAIRLLEPCPSRFAADSFSVGDPLSHFFALLVRKAAA